MQYPFPGMDPYLETRAIWPDFQTRFIAFLSGQLQRLVRPKYAAILEERVYVVERDRMIRPDITLSRQRRRTGLPYSSSSAALLEAPSDEPVRFKRLLEEVREPSISLVARADKRVVTTLELISPDNKRPGTGRQQYLQKREERLAAGVNVVEIDLLRDGEPLVLAGPQRLATLKTAWRYVVCVTRRTPGMIELYPVPLTSRLPCVAIPLDLTDPDVALDLQATFSRCWEEGPYGDTLPYENPPPGELSTADKRWIKTRIKSATGRR
jgi:hypothetical protein